VDNTVFSKSDVVVVFSFLYSRLIYSKIERKKCRSFVTANALVLVDGYQTVPSLYRTLFYTYGTVDSPVRLVEPTNERDAPDETSRL